MTTPLKIITKTQAAINKTLKTSDTESDNGAQHTDGIVCHVEGSTTYYVDAIFKSTDFIDIQLTISTDSGPVFISPKWVKEAYINDTPVAITAPALVGDLYFKLPDGTYYEYSSKSVISDLATCPACNSVITTSGSDLCDTCVNEFSELQSYSYKPTPNFIGNQSQADADHPIHYGIEIEYAAPHKHQVASLSYNYRSELYLKSDSSIQGDSSYKVEIVSHPHSFKALMSPSSFIHKLPKITVADGGVANGLHIHISRTAFRSDKHFSLFYFLLSSNRDLIEFIGKRELTNYCRHAPKGLVYTKANKPQPNYERKVMINENNDNTIEIRFFNSTNDTHVIKSYIQFLDSMIKYSNYHGTTVSLARWKTYVLKYKDKYSELASRLADFKHSLKGTVKFKPPVTKPVSKTALDFLLNLQHISEITTHEGTFEVDQTASITIYSGSASIEFRPVNDGWKTISFSDIISTKTTKDA